MKQSSLSSSSPSSSWRLCTVTQVEEVKLVARVAPVWLTTFTYGVMVAQTSTVYVSQVSSMETSRVPPASFQASMTLVVLLWVPIYERVAGGGAHMTTLRRIGVGLFLSVLSVAAAALVDGRRLEASARMSAWWTVPQYVLLGIADVYTLVGEQEFFYDQVLGSFRLFWVRVVNRTHSLKFCVCFILGQDYRKKLDHQVEINLGLRSHGSSVSD